MKKLFPCCFKKKPENQNPGLVSLNDEANSENKKDNSVEILKREYRQGNYNYLKKIDFIIDSEYFSVKDKRLDANKIRDLKAGIRINQEKIIGISFEDNRLGHNIELLKELLSPIKYCKNLKFLRFDNEDLVHYPENMEIIFDALLENEKLENIHLSFNLLADRIESMKILGRRLKEIKNLKNFNFNINHLADNIECMKIFSDMLKENNKLETLHLDNNGFSKNYEENLEQLAIGLKWNQNLKELWLEENFLKHYSNYFKEIAENNPNLKIYIGENRFEQDAIEEFKRLNNEVFNREVFFGFDSGVKIF
jgi:hypothetical protein